MSAQLFGRQLRNLIKWPFYRVYERRLFRKARRWELPQHIGIILDGNRRYAREVGLSNVIDGHARGADKIHDVLGWCFDLNISNVTVWVFSTDNFSRQQEEVDGLMQLFEEKTLAMVNDRQVHENQVRVQYIGRLDQLPESLQEAIAKAEDATRDYTRFTLNVAVAYGGREEIIDGVRHYIRDKCETGTDLEVVLNEMEPDSLSPYLYAANVPDPDLIIRTSGEVRLSGFLLWQSAYSEYYFCDTYWPEFRKIDFLRAVRSYNDRQRRYGK